MPAIHVDPWQKAAECERALRITTDLQQRQLLAYLQGMWISLANEAPFLTSDQVATEIDLVTQIQLDMHADINGRAPGGPALD